MVERQETRDASQLSGALLLLEELASRIEAVTAELADEMKWNGAQGCSYRDAADGVLRTMAQHGLIEHREHPFGGNVYRVKKELFGRTDGVENFDELPVLYFDELTVPYGG